MTPHRGARTRCIVGGNRLDDGGVIANGLSRQVGSVKMLLHSPPQLGALRPQSFDHQFERTVTGSLGQSQMKIAIALLADAEIVDVGLHAPDGLSQAFDIVVAGIRGRQRRNFTLDQLTRAQELERTRANVAIPRARRSRGRGHEDAGSDAHLDQPTDFERNDGLAHRRATHAELGRQFALGRKARSRLELSSGDKTRDLVRDLPVQATRLDDLQRQGVSSGKVQPIVYRDCGGEARRVEPILTPGYNVVKWSNHHTTLGRRFQLMVEVADVVPNYLASTCKSLSPRCKHENNELPDHRLLPGPEFCNA